MRRGAARATLAAVALSVLPGCFAAPPQIIALSPGRSATNVPADAPIVVAFDHPIDLDSLRGRLSIRPSLPGCDLAVALLPAPDAPCSLRPLEGKRGFELNHPGAVFAPSTGYAITLSAGVRDATGAVNSIDHHWELTSAPAPAVQSIVPGDGISDVPADSPLTITFTQPMRQSTTGGAVSLSPAIDGTRVVRSRRDPSRYLVLPGALLEAGTIYRLAVTSAATDEHGQRLRREVSTRFRAGAPGGGAHAVVLLHRGSERASRVALSSLSPPQPGDPTPSTTLLDAPRCGSARCGSARLGEPLVHFLDAALSPRSNRLAVVSEDATLPAPATPSLTVLDLSPRRVIREVAGGTLPAWSPDGRLVVFAGSGAAEMLRADGNSPPVTLPGAPPAAEPAWSPDGQTLALPTVSPGGAPRVEIANPLVGARYSLPGVDGATADPAFSPSGHLALHRESPAGAAGVEMVDPAGGSPAALLATGDLHPIGFRDDSTVVVIDRSSATPRVVEVDIGSGQLTGLDLGPAERAGTITVSTREHRLAWLADVGGTTVVRVATTVGGDRHELTDPADGFLPTAVSLN